MACLLVGGSAGAQPADRIAFDFEAETPDGWQVVEGDFGRFLCDRPVWYDGKPFGKQGKGFLSTIETPEGPWNDGLTGVAESPVFILSAPSLSFLIGGGNKDSAYVALCGLDGTELARATGHESHLMRRVEWEVPAAVGRPVFLRLVDRHTGGYGWLTLDRFQGRRAGQSRSHSYPLRRGHPERPGSSLGGPARAGQPGGPAAPAHGPGRDLR